MHVLLGLKFRCLGAGEDVLAVNLTENLTFFTKIGPISSKKVRSQTKVRKIEPNTNLAAPGALGHRLHAAPPGKPKMATTEPRNGQQGLERGLTLGFWALPSTFAK